MQKIILIFICMFIDPMSVVTQHNEERGVIVLQPKSKFNFYYADSKWNFMSDTSDIFIKLCGNKTGFMLSDINNQFQTLCVKFPEIKKNTHIELIHFGFSDIEEKTIVDNEIISNELKRVYSLDFSIKRKRWCKNISVTIYSTDNQIDFEDVSENAFEDTKPINCP